MENFVIIVFSGALYLSFGYLFMGFSLGGKKEVIDNYNCICIENMTINCVCVLIPPGECILSKCVVIKM